MRSLLLLVLIAFGLGGCYGVDKRFGLDPVLDPVSVEAASSNQIRILSALAADAGIVPGGPATWYGVAQAGFNYVDDQCNDYFQQIFFINRDRERVKSGLGAGSAVTAAILGVTGASAATLAIAAQAFGLGIAGTDFGTSQYLYQLPPSTTQGFVKELQLAYREGIAERRALIDSGPAAYHAIQDYLSLCLPPTIEAKLAEHIASARAAPDPLRLTRSLAFGLNLSTPPPVSRLELRRVLGDEIAVTPPTGGGSAVRPSRPPFVVPGVGTAPAKPSAELLALKRTLCVDGPEAETGSIGPETERSIRAFKAGYGAIPVASVDGRLTAATLRNIGTAERRFPSCGDAVRNAYEVGVYTRYGPGEVGRILRSALEKRNLPADAVPDRVAIVELRKAYGQDGPDALDETFWLRARDESTALPEVPDPTAPAR